MSETPEADPEHADVGDLPDDEFDPAEIEDDPAYDPDDEELKDIKGG